MATRTSRRGRGGSPPIQVQAQFLREAEARTLEGPLSGFAITLGDEALRLGTSEANRTTDWQQADLTRAIAAVQEAGVSCYQVEVAPDGTITIVVGAPDAPR